MRAGEERDAASVAETHVRRVERYRFGLVPDADLVNYSVAKKRLLAGLDPSGRRTVEYFVTEEGYQAVAYVLLQVTRRSAPESPKAGAWPPAAIATLKARASARCCRCCWRGIPASARRSSAPGGPRACDRRSSRSRGAAWPREILMIRPLRDDLRIEPWLVEGDTIYWNGDAF